MLWFLKGATIIEVRQSLPEQSVTNLAFLQPSLHAVPTASASMLTLVIEGQYGRFKVEMESWTTHYRLHHYTNVTFQVGVDGGRWSADCIFVMFFFNIQTKSVILH